MKRVLFIIESLNIGGMERVQVDLANTLVRNGHDVTIIMYKMNDECNFVSEIDSRVHLIYKPQREFNIMSKLPYIHRFYRRNKWETRTSAKSLYRYYVGKNEKYDVEIAFYRGPSVKIISGSTNKKAKKIAWVHNDYKLVDPRSIAYFFKDMEHARSAYKKFDKIIAVSEQARKNFIDVIGYPEKTCTIYNMISRENILKKSYDECYVKKTKFTLISVGRLIEAKGYDTLLRVVKKLNDDGYVFDLWLVGDGRCEKELKKYAEENNLYNVYFAGKQLNPYVYMRQADLYVCSSWREGFSVVIAEAMTCGLPIISTKCTGPSEVLDYGKYGILIENNEEAIYKELKKILSSPQLLNEYKDKSIERSLYFDANRIIEEIEDEFFDK